MKKCKGCGVILQNDNPDMAGYCPDLKQDYCQRCFRLSHYGDLTYLNKAQVSNEDIFKIYAKYHTELFVLVVDCFDALFLDQDKLPDYFKDKKVILVINKIDLLPHNVNDDKLDEIYQKIISKCHWSGLLDVILTYRHDQYFNELFYRILSYQKCKKIVFAGRANAGKSTLINRLINNRNLTVSPYPGTTVADNIIEYQDYFFIDTPGLLDQGSMLSYIADDKIHSLLPLKTLHSKVYQLYSPQSYFVEGLMRIDIVPQKRASVVFLISDECHIHRCKKENADLYFQNNQEKLNLKLLPWKKHKNRIAYNRTYYVKGLGLFCVNGRADISLMCYDQIDIYNSEVKI